MKPSRAKLSQEAYAYEFIQIESRDCSMTIFCLYLCECVYSVNILLNYACTYVSLSVCSCSSVCYCLAKKEPTHVHGEMDDSLSFRVQGTPPSFNNIFRVLHECGCWRAIMNMPYEASKLHSRLKELAFLTLILDIWTHTSRFMLWPRCVGGHGQSGHD